MNSTFTDDPWYESLRGRVVRQHTIRGITLDGWEVRRTVTVIDFGKVDPPQVDPDKQALVRPGYDMPRRMQPKTMALLERIHDTLRARPMSIKQLAETLGETPARLQALLRHPGHEMVVVSSTGGTLTYGVEGHDYGTPVLPPTASKIAAYLREHGPTTTPTLARELGMHKTTVQKCLDVNPDAFVLVGPVPASSGSGRPAHLWDIAR